LDVSLVGKPLSTPERARIPLMRPVFAWLLVIAGSVLILLTPALWNGFPFLFYDSGAYLDLAIAGGFRPERSAFYGAFLGMFRPQLSLWIATSAQVLLTVLVIADFARVLSPRITPSRVFFTILGLCLVTGLPWKAADILPDILAPVLVLCLYLLGFHGDRLSLRHKAALSATAVLAATSHASHLGLAAGLAAVIALIQIALRRATVVSSSANAKLPALVFGLSLMLVVAGNFVLTGDVFVSRSGPGFILARLVQDGVAQRVLNDTCPQAAYRLCAYRNDLPQDSNDFLWKWQSPLSKLGGFTAIEPEAKSIIVESLERYPWLNLKMAILDTLAQFATFRTGDGIEPLNSVPVPALRKYMPRQLASYLASRQRNGEIRFTLINTVQIPVESASMACLAVLLFIAVRRRVFDDRLFLPAFMLVALLGNAFICGALSSPHDRYQSRLMWPVCLSAILLLARWSQDARLRRPELSIESELGLARVNP